ncbi:MAG: DUF2911 domain-containing protein [Thermoanaerobaculia bacterium]
MRRSPIVWIPLALFAPLLASSALVAQFVELAPSGDNQRSTVLQGIGPVEVEVRYSSPNVHAPDGTDRRGKIWGELVPYGLVNLNFGTCGEQCPWRGGSNENTTVRFSHDVEVEGTKLAAGIYGLHFIPGKDEWVVIFSHDSTSWGSFSYDAKEDALRVTVKPAAIGYHEFLDYEFTDRQADRATLALEWEELQVPVRIVVPEVIELYVAGLRQQLRSRPGFQWEGWNQAAGYLLDNKVHGEEALAWAQNAVALPGIGVENFQTLSTLARAQEGAGKAVEAKATRDKALRHPTATVIDLHQYGRQLLRAGDTAGAIQVFELNAKRFPNQWPVNAGLMRAYAAAGKSKESLKAARAALTQAPDDVNRNNLKSLIAKLEKGDTAIN